MRRHIQTKNLKALQKEIDAEEWIEPVFFQIPKPKTYGDCPKEGPCPFVSCKYHLYLDVSENGSIKYNHTGSPLELENPCALRAIDDGVGLLEDIGKSMNVTKERVRQIEREAMHKVRVDAPRTLKKFMDALDEYQEETNLTDLSRSKRLIPPIS